MEGTCSCGGGGSQTQSWTYDDNLNLTSATDGLGHTTSFTYGSNGNPLTTTDNTGTRSFTYNSFGQILTSTDQMSGVTTNTFDVKGNLLTSSVADVLGNSVEGLSYDSFGNASASTHTRYDFTGRERDETTGLLYYRARWYDATLGRFISQDPIGFAGGDINLYRYVGQNPLNGRDPSGLIWDPSAAADRLDRWIDGVVKWGASVNPDATYINSAIIYSGNTHRGLVDMFLRYGTGAGRFMFHPCGSYRDLFQDAIRGAAIAGTVLPAAKGIGALAGVAEVEYCRLSLVGERLCQ